MSGNTLSTRLKLSLKLTFALAHRTTQKYKLKLKPTLSLTKEIQTRADTDTAQTHGPPCIDEISFLLHNADMFVLVSS